MSLSVNNPAESYTIEQFIDLQVKDDITYQNFSILQSSIDEPNTFYAIDNVIHRYIEDIKDQIKIVTVDDNYKLKYMYKPKVLSYDIYGATEMYFILMALNGIYNVKDFDLKDYKFKALDRDTMFSFASKVYNAEEETLLINRQYNNLV